MSAYLGEDSADTIYWSGTPGLGKSWGQLAAAAHAGVPLKPRQLRLVAEAQPRPYRAL